MFYYGLSLIQKTFVKSLESGLCDDILASKLRMTLRTPGITDDELMKQVNALASQQDERTTKLANEHQKRAKLNACEVPKEGGEQRARNPSSDGSQEIVSEIRQMKSEINDLKAVRRQNQTWADPPAEAMEVVTSQRTPSWGCHDCEERGRGEDRDYCFVGGSSGYVARECTRRRNQGRSRLGNSQRLFRRGT